MHRLLEPLESRQLLSLTIDVTLAGGGKTAQVTSVGQVIQMEIWAVIDGQNGTGTDDGVQSAHGAFLSTNQPGNGAVLGTLNATRFVAPTGSGLPSFNASGSSDGSKADLDGDGDQDIGSNSNTSSTPFFVARSDPLSWGRGTGPQKFKLGNLTFTATQLLSGTRTEINFRPRQYSFYPALWTEDGATKDPTKGTFVAGSPVVLTHAALPDEEAPTAAITAQTHTTGGPSDYTFTVRYTDNAQIKASTLDDNDILVTGPNGYSQLAHLLSPPTSDNSTITATYSIPAPGGFWNSTDGGTYTIALQENQVTDTANHAAATTTAQFLVNVPQDTQNPTATIAAENMTGGGGSDYTFTITYADNMAIDTASIGDDDVQVTGPNGYTNWATKVNVEPNASGSNLKVTYQVPTPGSAWDSADNGTYTLTLQDGAVKDLENHGVASSAKSFNVNLDTLRPVATIQSAPDVTVAGTSSYSLTVVYTDNTGIDTSSINNDDLALTGPDNFTQWATPVSIAPSPDGKTVTVGYRIVPPEGIWDYTDNGEYQIQVYKDSVRDTIGNGVLLVPDSFVVQLPPDEEAPTAAITADDLLTGGSATYTFTVKYSDNVAIDVNSIDNTDVQVTGPGGYSQWAQRISVDVATGVATYRVTAPKGYWSSAANGTYTVSLAADQVTDASGTGVAAASVQFEVSAPNAVLTEGVPGITDGTLLVTGTDLANNIRLAFSGGQIAVNVDGTTSRFTASSVKGIQVNGLGGNDRINLSNVGIGALIDGGIANDIITGGIGNDTINGGDGNDQLNGGNGNDTLRGQAGNDRLNGANGNDRVDGGDGKDVLTGGNGNDTLYGGSGVDTLNGNVGRDRLFGDADNDLLQDRDGSIDTLNGGSGTDSAKADKNDKRTAVEKLLK